MFHLLKRIASEGASASRVSRTALLNPAAGPANGLQRKAFCFSGFLARLMQETDRSVS
jgi:16S rRNA C1402 (ribose-2'-O) methylase RsmI